MISHPVCQVMTLNQRTISEIRSYAHPIAEIHTVMRATLLLLGNPEEETKVGGLARAVILVLSWVARLVHPLLLGYFRNQRR